MHLFTAPEKLPANPAAGANRVSSIETDPRDILHLLSIYSL